MSVEEKRFFGKVDKRVEPNMGSGNPPFGFVKPILESSPDLTRWESEISDRSEHFPDRGLIYWYDTPPEYDAETYVSFDVKDSLSYSEGRNPDQYQVDGFRSPIEVIDLRGYDESDLRGIIGSFGVNLDHEPASDELLIWIEDDTWVGPVSLKQNDMGRWELQSNDPTRLDCWKAPEEGCSTVQHSDGERTFLSPNRDFGRDAGFKNWAPPEEFALSVLKRIRKFDQEAYEALDTTYSAFEKYFDTLSEAGLTDRQRIHELARKERLEDLLKTIEENQGLIETATDALISSPEVQEELQERRREIHQEMKEELEEELRESLQERYDELEGIEEEIEAREDELRDIEQQIADAEESLEEREKELSEQVEKYDEHLSERLADLLEKPEEAFADLAIITQAIRTFDFQPKGRETPELDPQKEEVGTERDTEVECIDPDEAVTHVGMSFLNRDSPYHAALDLHSAFVSGAIPILDGEGASDALQAYSDAITGGRIQWTSIGGSTYEPTDLLGHYDHDSSRIIPSRHGLLETIREAKKTGKLYLFVLEGFNRAPVESYLLPLLQTRNLPGQRRDSRSIPLAPAGLSGDDPFGNLRTVELPENVLVAGIPANGPSTLPVPDKIWNHAVLLSLPAYRDVEVDEDSYPTSEIDSGDWSELVRRACDEDKVSRKLRELRDEIREGNPRFRLNRLQYRIYGAARRSVDPTAALELLVRSNLIHSLQEIEEVSKYIDDSNMIESSGLDHILEAGKSLTNPNDSL